MKNLEKQPSKSSNKGSDREYFDKGPNRNEHFDNERIKRKKGLIRLNEED